MDHQEKKNLYKCRRTVLEMLADRKHTIPENFHLDFENFLLLLEEHNLDIHVDDTFVRFMYDHNKNLTKKDLDIIVEEIREATGNPDIQIVLILKINPSKTSMEAFNRVKNVEIFCQDYLVFNPTRHRLVPQHILLTKEEEDDILKKYHCTKAQLPKLSVTDPIAKYYGMKPGDVCKIIRQSQSMGEHYYYRHVR